MSTLETNYNEINVTFDDKRERFSAEDLNTGDPISEKHLTMQLLVRGIVLL